MSILTQIQGKVKDSNIRTTIFGINAIQKYCKENIIYEDKLKIFSFYKNFEKR